ncbi:MAG: AMMECR1 domain-containing protein [Candidatus Eremiobacterota bacterium]
MYYFLRNRYHASRITHHASRITHHASRITYHASRISRITRYASRVTRHASRLIVLLFLFLSLNVPLYAFDSEGKNNILETIRENPQVQDEILNLSVNTILLWLKEGKTYNPSSKLSWVMNEKCGVFVTLEKYGVLRGCRGTIWPVYATLKEEIINSSIGAISRDSRFPPVTIEEFRKLHITVTVVGKITPVVNPEKEIDPLVHGVLVETCDGQKKGVMLPGEAPTLEHEIAWAKKRASITGDEPVYIYRFTGVRFSKDVKVKSE